MAADLAATGKARGDPTVAGSGRVAIERGRGRRPAGRPAIFVQLSASSLSPILALAIEMGSQTTKVFLVLLVAAVVSIDLLFFRNRFWERLTVNIGIIVVFAAFYFRFLKRP